MERFADHFEYIPLKWIERKVSNSPKHSPSGVAVAPGLVRNITETFSCCNF